MHIMNAMVAAINAYQHYQKDVERSYHEIESSMASNKTHSHNQVCTHLPHPPALPVVGLGLFLQHEQQYLTAGGSERECGIWDGKLGLRTVAMIAASHSALHKVLV